VFDPESNLTRIGSSAFSGCSSPRRLSFSPTIASTIAPHFLCSVSLGTHPSLALGAAASRVVRYCDRSAFPLQFAFSVSFASTGAVRSRNSHSNLGRN
jgi:hypothetical protein